MAYQASSSCQIETDFGDGVIGRDVNEDKLIPKMEEHIYDVLKEVKPDQIAVCLSCPSEDNWRLRILPSYKENRKGKEKPVLYKDAINYIHDNYKVYERPTLEADDVMGILSTSPKIIKGRKVIVSIDKDFQTIPGWLWNPSQLNSKPIKVSVEEADWFHMYQTLVGDSVDNYKGCPGIGDKRATRILESAPEMGTWEDTLGEMWAKVVEAFERKGLSEQHALIQAQVSRITRNTDYDFTKKEVIPWTLNNMI